MTITLSLYLESPKAKSSKVYVRKREVHTRKKPTNTRLFTIPNLTVNPKHWVKGGIQGVALSPLANAQDRQYVEQLSNRLKALHYDLNNTPRKVTAQVVQAFLFPAPSDLMPKLIVAAHERPKLSTRQTYGWALNDYAKWCRIYSKEATAETFTQWAKALGQKVQAGKMSAATANVYAAGVRSCFAAIGIEVKRQGLRLKQTNTGSDLHALTPVELHAIAALELTANTPIAKVRDAFLCGCLTSLRHSDWHHFTTANLGRKVSNTKTGKQTVLPDTSDLRSIIHRNGGAITLTNAKGHQLRPNPYIRRIAKLAAAVVPSLSTEVDYKGRTVPKWQAITSHSARRTFVSVGISNGSSLTDLKEFTGHANNDQLLKYAKPIITQAQQMDQAAKVSASIIDLGSDLLNRSPAMQVA